MDINKLRTSISKLIAELDSTRERDTLLIAKEARALIVRRIQKDGKDAAGKSFGKYSNNPLPTFFYDNILTNSQKNKVRAKARKEGRSLSYKEVRETTGRQTRFVDMTFTGDMWKGTVAIIESQDRDSVTAAITGKTKDVLLKLGYNSARYGNILKLSEDELKKINLAALNRIERIIGKFLK